jgi:hypothetical protein
MIVRMVRLLALVRVRRDRMHGACRLPRLLAAAACVVYVLGIGTLTVPQASSAT